MDNMTQRDVQLPNSGGDPTDDEVRALSEAGLWDDQADYGWSRAAVLDAYRHGYRDGKRDS